MALQTGPIVLFFLLGLGLLATGLYFLITGYRTYLNDKRGKAPSGTAPSPSTVGPNSSTAPPSSSAPSSTFPPSSTAPVRLQIQSYGELCEAGKTCPGDAQLPKFISQGQTVFKVLVGDTPTLSGESMVVPGVLLGVNYQPPIAGYLIMVITTYQPSNNNVSNVGLGYQSTADPAFNELIGALIVRQIAIGQQSNQNAGNKFLALSFFAYGDASGVWNQSPTFQKWLSNLPAQFQKMDPGFPVGLIVDAAANVTGQTSGSTTGAASYFAMV